MKVERGDREGVAVLKLEGEFDSFETEMVRKRFEECVRSGQHNVILDLGDMSFANSTTIAYFLTARRRATDLGGDVVLVAPQDFILKTLQTLGFDRVFSIAETVEEAAQKLKSA